MKLIRYETPQHRISSLAQLVDWLRSQDRQSEPGNTTSAFGALASAQAQASVTQIGADLYEDENGYYVRFEAPGVKKHALKVELHNAVLTVSYESQSVPGNDADTSTSYSRSLSIPDGIDAEHITAAHVDGLLTITLPKAKVKKSQAIQVS